VPESELIKGIEWLGVMESYHDSLVRGDTYPLTWADDNEMYMSSGDPLWGPINYAYVEKIEVYGQSTFKRSLDWSMHGLDMEKLAGSPDNYVVTKVNDMVDYIGFGGRGPKPAGMICVDGTLYLSVQNIHGAKDAPASDRSQHGSDASIIFSEDKGLTWEPSFKQTWFMTMFRGWKFGGPAFVQFGKNNEDAVDDYVYAISGQQWDNGNEIRLGRVHRDSIMYRYSWSFVSDMNEQGEPVWTRNLDASKSVLTIHDHISLPEMVYIKNLDRYLLLTWKFNIDFNSTKGSSLIILESENPWGPFKLAHFEKNWETDEVSPYCPRLPLKWYDQENNEGYLLFSGSWRLKSPYYRVNTRKFKLIL
jgi:hypothetical protein